MMTPGPKPGQSFPTTKPAAGSDLGGRRPKPNLAEAQAVASTGSVNANARYGKWPSQGNPHGPQPEIIEGQPHYNPFERRWIE